MSIHIEAKSSGQSRQVLGRGTWSGDSLPLARLRHAVASIELAVLRTEPRSGVALIIRVVP